MIIKSLMLVENQNQSNDSFSSGVNLIYSTENTKGKTTFLRLLFYSLGYQIPSMKQMDFKNIYTEVCFEEKGERFNAKREKDILSLYKNELLIGAFSLPSMHEAFLSTVFNYNKVGVLNNLLGFMYIDQEKGWTLLNRGTVVGRIRFSIEELLSSLKGADIVNLLEEKSKLEQDKSKYEALLDLQALKDQMIGESLSNDVSVTSDLEIELSQKISRLTIELNNLNSSIKSLSAAIEKEQQFKDYIDSMMLRIRVDGYEDGVLVKSDDIIGYEGRIDVLKIRRNVLSIECERKSREKKTLEKKLFEEQNKKYSNTLFKDENNRFFAIDKAIISFDDIDQESVNAALEDVKKKLREIRKKIRETVKLQNTFIDSIYNKVLTYAAKLGISDRVDPKKDFIFTTDLKSLSGAALQKIVIAFKIAFLVVVQEDMGTSLPLVLDSPKSRELDDANTKLIMDLINEELSKNQVFIASIFDCYHYDKKITLIHKAVEERKNN